MSEHTKGPWEVVTMSPRTKGGQEMICVRAVDSPINSNLAAIGHSELDQANARLIAAAPDLLEACKEAHSFLCSKEPTVSIKIAVGLALEAAIAEAEEVQP